MYISIEITERELNMLHSIRKTLHKWDTTGVVGDAEEQFFDEDCIQLMSEIAGNLLVSEHANVITWHPLPADSARPNMSQQILLRTRDGLYRTGTGWMIGDPAFIAWAPLPGEQEQEQEQEETTMLTRDQMFHIVFAHQIQNDAQTEDTSPEAILQEYFSGDINYNTLLEDYTEGARLLQYYKPTFHRDTRSTVPHVDIRNNQIEILSGNIAASQAYILVSINRRKVLPQ